jgi:DNA polymerase-3 subunit delta'
MFSDPAPAPDTLDIDENHPVAHRISALSEPRLFLLRRAWDQKKKKLKTVITVDEARKLHNFFSLSAADGGRRVVIVDTADEMNTGSANALLKMLEEPPALTTLFLISHKPTGLLPTIRSRCRELRCHPLDPDQMGQALARSGIPLPEDTAALAELADGSVGEAIRLINLGGLEQYRELAGLVGTMPNLDRPRARRLAQSMVGATAATRYEMLLGLIDLFLARTARTGIKGPPAVNAAPNEAALLSRLCPGPAAARQWAELHQTLGARTRHGVSVNLDPASLILDTVFRINALAGNTATG